MTKSGYYTTAARLLQDLFYFKLSIVSNHKVRSTTLLCYKDIEFFLTRRYLLPLILALRLI